LEFNVPFQHKYGYIRDDGNSDNFEVKVGVHQGLALYCGKNKCLWKQIELVFGIKVSTEDSCFVLDEGLDLLTEKGDLHGAGVLDLENFQLLLCHGHCPNNCWALII